MTRACRTTNWQGGYDEIVRFRPLLHWVRWLCWPPRRPDRLRAGAAANFPNKPIRVIVPFAAGGGNDIFARLVGQKAGEILGQTFVIENRPAAGGRLGGGICHEAAA